MEQHSKIRCRPDTFEGHFKSETHKDAYEASQRRENSYFDREEEKKGTMLKNEVYFKVLKALYWLAKEEIESFRILECSDLLEFSKNSSSNADAIVSCITEKF